MSSDAQNSGADQENLASESSVPSENRPICLIVLGMAGSGKTSFVNRLSSFEVQEHNPYIINLDPACKDTPYPTKIDIRNTLNYKEVMKQYRLGPNGAIVTSLNLFATKFNDVIDFIKKSSPEHKYCVIDTPGQIEVFTWSVSGTIITEGLASSFPTVIVYVIDTVRSVSPVTFMSNMLYACSILYKAKLPFIVVLNKTDVVDHSFAVEWMNDFEAYQEALHADDNDDFRYRLMDSLSMVLDEFYKDLRVCGVSALTGDGFDQFYKLVADAANEYETKYKIEWEKLRAESKIKKEKEHKAKLERLAAEGPSAAGEASTSSTSITEIWSGRELSDVYLKHPANESSEDEDGEEVEMKSLDSDEDDKKEAESFKTFLANQVKKQKSRGPSVSKQNT